MLMPANNPAVTPLAHLGRSVFDRPNAEQARWSALYTRPRQEKALAADLATLGIDYFLPLVTKVFVSGGRKRKGINPLFPSYVFAAIADSTRVSVLRTERIVQTIDPEPAVAATFECELRAIETAVLNCPEHIELQPRVVEGTYARVTSGAMKGMEGLVVQSHNRTKIWLQVKTLGTGVLVEIESDMLEPIS